VAVVGHIHHGKTSLVDMLVRETHEQKLDMELLDKGTDVSSGHFDCTGCRWGSLFDKAG
jgi:translation initiation factor 2 gamma subunit (eIF-2gamma)